MTGLILSLIPQPKWATAAGTAVLAMLAFGKELMASSAEHHTPARVMHRVIVFSASTFDTLPHSGFIIILLCVCGLTHKQSYKELFIITCIFPVVAVISMIAYTTFFLI